MVAAAMPPTAIALAVFLLLGGAAIAAARALGTTPDENVAASEKSPSVPAARSVNANRLAVAVAAGFLVLLATRWLMLALLAAAMVFSWKRLLHDQRADDERRRVEGIAKWLEDLRDTLRGSAVAAEEALEQVALRPPTAIAAPLQHFLQHRRQGYRTEDALIDLGDELAHPTADAAIAAICLVIGGSTGAGRLYGTVNSLAAAARFEVTARERIDRTRAVYQSSMKRLIVIGALLVAYLRFAAGGLLDPYNTAAGQVVLLLPLGMWLGCVLWLRSLCGYEAAR
ncbi:hypothetical protein BH10ACT2_BH10ACT2_20150 [soil metagenome]